MQAHFGCVLALHPCTENKKIVQNHVFAPPTTDFVQTWPNRSPMHVQTFQSHWFATVLSKTNGMGVVGGWGWGGERRRQNMRSRVRFSNFQIFDVYLLETYFRKNMLVRYRRINNKGVLERPGTKWKVLMTISSTLKFQYFRKADFPMPCKTKSHKSSTECLRMVCALPPDTPRPHQFHLKQWKNMLLWTTRFFSFLLVFCPYVAGVLVEKNNCWSAKWLRSNNGIIKYLWLSMDIHGYTWISMGPMGAKKQQKAAEKHKNLVFHKNLFFHYFKWNWWGLGVSRVSALTIRRHSVELWQDLVLHGMRGVHFSEILEFQCTRNCHQNLPFCPGSLQDTFIIYSSISHQHISPKMFPGKQKLILQIWKKKKTGTYE